MKIKRKSKELTINAPWGKIALLSWGNPKSTPVLLTHGYMDSAATFIILMEQLPDNYYYVALDIPGHGKSDPFPPGLTISQLHVVEVIRIVVEQLKWHTFIYMAHSMSCIIGAFYNYLFPNKISRMILLDPGPAFAAYYYVHFRIKFWYHFLYNDYYENYSRMTPANPNQYTSEQAITLLVRTRSLTEEQAEVVLSRALVPSGDDTYRLSWDTRMKKIVTGPVSEDTLFHILSTNMPPTLAIAASEFTNVPPGTEFGSNILQKCQQFVPNFNIVQVQGGHDIHITNPDGTAPHIATFLHKQIDSDFVKAKL